MTEHRKLYKTFTREFKLEALRLMEQSDKPSINQGVSQLDFHLSLPRGVHFFCVAKRNRTKENATRHCLISTN